MALTRATTIGLVVGILIASLALVVGVAYFFTRPWGGASTGDDSAGSASAPGAASDSAPGAAPDSGPGAASASASAPTSDSYDPICTNGPAAVRLHTDFQPDQSASYFAVSSRNVFVATKLRTGATYDASDASTLYLLATPYTNPTDIQFAVGLHQIQFQQISVDPYDSSNGGNPTTTTLTRPPADSTVYVLVTHLNETERFFFSIRLYVQGNDDEDRYKFHSIGFINREDVVHPGTGFHTISHVHYNTADRNAVVQPFVRSDAPGNEIIYSRIFQDEDLGGIPTQEKLDCYFDGYGA